MYFIDFIINKTTKEDYKKINLNLKKKKKLIDKYFLHAVHSVTAIISLESITLCITQCFTLNTLFQTVIYSCVFQ